MQGTLLTSTGDVVNSRPVVLNDGSSASLDSQDTGHLQDDVLGRRPARHLASQFHSYHLWTEMVSCQLRY